MRKVGGVFLAAAMLLPVGLIAAGPASAGAPALTCTKIAGTATFTPPVSPTVSVTHNVSSKSTISGCTGTAGITSGVATFTSKGTTKQNCAQLIASKKVTTATITVKWSNGTTSGPGTATVTPVSTATVKITSKITKGQFAGKTSISTVLFIPKGGGCITAGKSLATTTVSLKAGTKLVIS